MLKETKLGGSHNLEFRAEFFNIFNHPAFAQPDTTFGTPGFGEIFNTLGRTLGCRHLTPDSVCSEVQLDSE